jgi:hypothetical protein
MRTTYKVLVRRSERERPLGRPKRKSEDNIRMDVKETGCKGVDRAALAGSCLYGNEPLVSGEIVVE